MSQATEIADLLRKAGNASTLSEQTEFMRQAEELKSAHHTAAFGEGDWSAEDAVIRDTLVPGFAHEMHTASTDWLVDLDDSVDPRRASQSMIAEASLWFGRVDEDVKSYPAEYAEQARNLARRLAGQYGDFADQAEKTFLDETDRLRTTAVKAGLVVTAGDAGEAPEENKGKAQKKFEKLVEGEVDKDKDGNVKDRDFRADRKHSSYEDEAANEEDEKVPDEFKTTGMRRAASFTQGADDLFAVLAASDQTEVGGTNGVYNDDPSLTSSNRAPALQELQSDSQDVVTPNDPGLGQTDDLTGANKNASGPDDHASKGTYPVHGNKKESSMGQQFGACPTCGGHGKVAVRTPQLPRIEDITRTAASGLDQIDQTVDSHDNPKSTLYPDPVAFPWVLNPAAQVPAAINQAEEQIAQRNSLSPTQNQQGRQSSPRQSVQSSARTAGGRDNSGWMGDNGARGVDYPGEQAGQYPAPSTSEGYVDPAHGRGGETGQNGGVKPYGAMEADDYTNNPGQNWQPGQPTQDDNGWREVVQDNPALQAAAAFVEQHHQAYLRNGR